MDKTPLYIIMPDGSDRVVEFSSNEYGVADLMAAGKTNWEIEKETGFKQCDSERLKKNNDFMALVESKKYWRGKSEALTADFVKATLMDRIKGNAELSPQQLTLLKMGMQATGLTKQGAAGGHGRIQGFNVVPKQEEPKDDKPA